MSAIKHIFTRIRSTEGSSADCSLFILSLHALALHLAVKILRQIFLYEDLSTLLPYICRLYFLPEMQQDRTLLHDNTMLSENIPNICAKSSTKHRSDQIETIKTIMQTTRPSYHMEGLPIAQVAIFKEIFDQVRKDLDCELFYSELKRHNVSHYIYYLATDNIHIVLENDNTVLIKDLKGCKYCKFSGNTHLIETSYDRLKSREITFQQYRENLAKAGVFRWVTNIHEHKRCPFL